MAYIGHSASGNFTTKPSKDTFSGDGSTTAFTLSEGATTNTVDVFVENVRQEPTTAYTVDGTTLTFTAAPGSGTNNIYVVNRGPLQLSATHPAAQALEASTGTFTGDLTVDTNTLHVDSTNNNVGIGTTSTSFTFGGGLEITKPSGTPATMRVEQALGTPVGGEISAYSDSFGMLVYTTTNHPITFGTSGGEKMRLLAGGGLTFNGDTAAANALDDYEEGTFTPTAGSNVSAISSAEGFYTKIGNIVVLEFKGILTPTSTSSGMIIGGLPFAVSDKVTSTQVEATGVAYEDSSLFVMFPLGSTSTFQIELDRPIQGSASGSAKTYRGNFTYFTG